MQRRGSAYVPTAVDAAREPSMRDHAVQYGRMLMFGIHDSKQAIGTAGLFPLTTGPARLAKFSSFLGLHFAMLILFMLLTFAYCLVSIHPLISYWKTELPSDPDGPPRMIIVKKTNEDAKTATYDLEHECTENELKAHRFVEPSRFIHRLTFGSFCYSARHSYSLFCSHVCEALHVDVMDCSVPVHENCTHQEAAGKPCCEFIPLWSIEKGDSDVERGDSDLEQEYRRWGAKKAKMSDAVMDRLGHILDKEPPRIALFGWEWCLAGTLLYSAWLMMLRRTLDRAAERATKTNVTAANYAVLLSNVGKCDGKDEDLEEFGRHYGPVILATHIRTWGKVVSKWHEVDQLQKQLNELEVVRDVQEDPNKTRLTDSKRREGGVYSLQLFIYKRMLCLWRSVSDACKVTHKQIQKATQEARDMEDKEVSYGWNLTGKALIVFNNERDARQMLWDHQQRSLTTLLGKVIPQKPLSQFHIWTDGRFTNVPLASLKTDRRYKPTYVTVRAAPAPLDLLWRNAAGTRQLVQRNRVKVWLIFIIVLLVSLIVQGVLTVAAFKQTTAFDDEGEEGGQLTVQDYIRLRWVVGLKAVATMLFSVLGYVAVSATANYELPLTHTEYIGSMLTKLSIFHLTNSFIVPLAAVTVITWTQNPKEPTYDPTRPPIPPPIRPGTLWYAPGGYVEGALYVQLFAAVLPSLERLFDFQYQLSQHVLSYAAHTQTAANDLMEPPMFQMDLRVAQSVNSVGLAILHAPILPVSPFIALVGLVLSYATDHYLALRRARKLLSFGSEVFDGVKRIMRYLILVQLLLIYTVYFSEYQDYLRVPFWTGVVVFILQRVGPTHLMYYSSITGDEERKDKERAKWPTFLELQAKDTEPDLGQRAQTVQFLNSIQPDVNDKLTYHTESYYPIFNRNRSPVWFSKVDRYLRLKEQPKEMIAEPMPKQATRLIAEDIKAAAAVKKPLRAVTRTFGAPTEVSQHLFGRVHADLTLGVVEESQEEEEEEDILEDEPGDDENPHLYIPMSMTQTADSPVYR